MEHGAWSMGHGAWSMGHGAWSKGNWRTKNEEVKRFGDPNLITCNL